MGKILNILSEKTISDVVGEVIKTQTVSKSGNSYTCIVNGKYIVKVPFNQKTVRLLKQEVGISDVLQQCSLSVQTPAWRCAELGQTNDEGMPKYMSFCAVAPVIDGSHPAVLDEARLLSDLGQFLGRLHKIPATAFSGVQTYMDVDFNYMVDTWERQNRHQGIDKKRWKKFKCYLKNTVLRQANDMYIHNIQPVLTHADLHVGNVLVDKNGRLFGVLDFGNATLTPEPQDVLIAARGLKNGEAMLASYQRGLCKRADSQDKLQKTWRLAAMMNGHAERLLDKFLSREKQRS